MSATYGIDSRGCSGAPLGLDVPLDPRAQGVAPGCRRAPLRGWLGCGRPAPRALPRAVVVEPFGLMCSARRPRWTATTRWRNCHPNSTRPETVPDTPHLRRPSGRRRFLVVFGAATSISRPLLLSRADRLWYLPAGNRAPHRATDSGRGPQGDKNGDIRLSTLRGPYGHPH